MSLYYQDDYVTLYLGDCLEQTAWLEADVLLTDPPYGVAWKGGIGAYKNGKRQSKLTEGIANDESPDTRDNALAAWGSKPAIVFGSWRIARPVDTQHRLIWHKAGQAPGPANMPFMTQDEEIYIIGKGFKPSSPPLRSVITTTEARSIEVYKIGHPTPKPIGLMQTLIEKCPDGVIADPFAGSGATLVAAKNLGRKVIGVELEEKYCELIAKRLSQDTFDFSKLPVIEKETYTQEAFI
jgi:site-specific DNA-methyltransferase (adenine-specific)